jgi:hypothetical protein
MRSVNATARRLLLAILPAAALLPVHGAHAQANACDQLKGVLAARITIRNFTLETVEADTPVPAGAKVVGTCEGGARKILLRRGGAAAPADGASVTAPPVVAAPAKPARRVSEAAAPAPERAAPPVAAASSAETVRAVDVAPSAPAALPPPGSTEPQAPGFLTRHRHWLIALALLPIAGWLWAWIAHRRAYDSAGLPRGPRLE